MHWILFAIVFLLGGFLGIVIMALLNMARRADEEADRHAALFTEHDSK